MAQHPLADTQFFLHGESDIVARALGAYMGARGAQVTNVQRLDELKPPEDTENVLVVHYAPATGLAVKLPRLKSEYGSLRVLLLHEFTDRGKIEGGVLSATDHLLEKPFTQSSLDKALTQFRFRPLAGKRVYVFQSGDALPESLLKTLGAVVVGAAAVENEKPPVELAVFSPAALDDLFRSTLQGFRAAYPDVPIFMLYDPQAPGILDSAILNEIAYLVQRPIPRRALREKFLTFFDQPQRDRRKNPRKTGISQIWISAFNPELGTPELFESPFLIDISQSGLSFQSYMDYRENQIMSVWVVSEDHPDKIIDLKGEIRWRRHDAAEAPGAAFKYGVEFTKQNSPGYTSFARMIAMHAG